jgi:hypothetical protein
MTGFEYHFWGKKDHSSGRWVSSREIDLASMILERCRRRKAQLEKQAEKIRSEKLKSSKGVEQSKKSTSAMKENRMKSSQSGNSCAPDSYVSATAAAKVVFSGHAVELRRLLERNRGSIPAEQLLELRKESEDKLQLALGAESMLGADTLDTLFRQVEQSVTRSAGNKYLDVPSKSKDINMPSVPSSSEQSGSCNQEVHGANFHNEPTKIIENLPAAHINIQSQNSWQAPRLPVQVSSNFRGTDPASCLSQNPSVPLHSAGVPQNTNPHSVVDCTNEAILQYQEQVRTLVRKFGGTVPQVELHPCRELCCQILSQVMQMANLPYSREKILQIIDEAESSTVSEELLASRRVSTAPFTSRTPALPGYPQPTNYNVISHQQNIHALAYLQSQQQQHHHLSLQQQQQHPQQQYSQFTQWPQSSQGFNTGANGHNMFHGVPQAPLTTQNYSNVPGQYYQDAYNNPCLGMSPSVANTFSNTPSSQSQPHQFMNSTPYYSNEVGQSQLTYNGNHSYGLPGYQPPSNPRHNHHQF